VVDRFWNDLIGGCKLRKRFRRNQDPAINAPALDQSRRDRVVDHAHGDIESPCRGSTAQQQAGVFDGRVLFCDFHSHINPSSQRCKWVAIDADYKNAMEDLVKLQYYLTQDRVDSALEMSRRGGHLWILLAVPLLAKKCRIYIYDLARRLGVPVKGSGLAEGIEVFPKHDAIAKGAFGNAIRGPLGIHRGANRRFWFYGADYTLEAQMKFLKRLRRVTEEELDRFAAGKELPADIAKSQREVKPIEELRTGPSRKAFCILDHVGKTRIVGKNHVARCPSCAQTGHDRSGDNLAILVSDPRFYQCWAGCTKEMIRAALGQPIRVQQRA